MCLTDLEKFWPAKVGYQVKRNAVGLAGAFLSIYQGHQMYYLGKTYIAKELPTWTESPIYKPSRHYKSGFHVFHKLSDAEKYMFKLGVRDRRFYAATPGALCIVKVECKGIKITGRQNFEYYKFEENNVEARTVDAKVTVCSKIKLLLAIHYKEKK
jgi:hypothetical protein